MKRTNQKSAYTTVISFDPNEFDAHTQKIVGRGYADYRTVYVPKGQSTGVAIPERKVELDLGKIEEARAWADKLRNGNL